MRHIFLNILLLSIAIFVFSCESPNASGEDSPTGAYTRLYNAVKSKNIDAVRAVMSKKTLEFAKTAAQMQNKTVEQVLENGFTATTFSPKLPQVRDQRIDGDMGAVEVHNDKENKWEDLPFIREDGQWKLAVGELFAGTFKSPGKSLSEREKEAANAANGNNIVPSNIANANQNTNTIKPIVPKPAANVPKNSILK
jgi:hypothetical protein